MLGTYRLSIDQFSRILFFGSKFLSLCNEFESVFNAQCCELFKVVMHGTYTDTPLVDYACIFTFRLGGRSVKYPPDTDCHRRLR